MEASINVTVRTLVNMRRSPLRRIRQPGNYFFGASKAKSKPQRARGPQRLSLCLSLRSLRSLRFILLDSLAEDKLVRRPFQRAAGFRTPQDCLFDLAGEGEVLVGDPARGMGLELDPKFAPRDRQ